MHLTIEKPNLTKYQNDILYNGARFTIVEASTKCGKTFSLIWWIFERAHEDWNRPGYNHWWIAPVYSQAKIAFNRLRRKVADSGVYKVNESNLIITCPSGAEIHFKSAEKPDNLYGEDVYSIVFDEAPRARFEAHYALRSTITSTGGDYKLIGNFGGISNWVHKLKEKAKTDPQYAYYKITCWDAIKEGILDLEEILQAQKDLPEKIFKALYEAEASEVDGQLIENKNINKLFRNENIQGGLNYITADIARFGKDKTVIAIWDGLKILEIKTLNRSSIPESAAAITALKIKYAVNNYDIIVDEDGVGGGVVDVLECQGFVNNSKPLKVDGVIENFSNLKSQCYYKLSEVINKQQMHVNCDEEIEGLLSEELEWVRLAKELDVSKISILSKDEIKKKLGRSPDYSDTIMMRCYFLLNPNKGKYNIGRGGRSLPQENRIYESKNNNPGVFTRFDT